MVSKKLITDYGWKNLLDYYDYIIESQINRNFSQVSSLINDLSKPQAVDFLQYMKRENLQDNKEELTALTLKSLKR